MPSSTCCTLHKRQVVFQFVYGVVAVTSLLGPGMSMGYSSVALPLLKNATAWSSSNKSETQDDIFIMTDQQIMWFASIPMISTPVGCLLSLLTMKAGRRFAMGSAGTVCSLGWIVLATSYSPSQLLIGRCITGFATGMASTPASVYLAEISMPRYTTMLTACSSFFISIGIMFVYLLGFLIKDDWRLVAAISIAVPAISAILTLTVMPESPRWLLNNGREDEARKSLLRLRSLKRETSWFNDEFESMLRYSNNSQPKYELEMISSINNVNRSGKNIEIKNIGNPRVKRSSRHFTLICKDVKDIARALTLPEVWKPFVILNVFFFFQQFCGIYALMAYAVDIITITGVVTKDPYFITAIIGIVQISAAFSLVLCSSRLGRRPIALISGVGMTASLAGLGIYNKFFLYTELPPIPLGCIILFVASGSFGFLALPWAMIGELFPTRFVNVLGPTTTCLGGLYNFGTVQLYPHLVAFGPMTMIYTYCIISFLATIFVAIVLPETRGKSKDEIEQTFGKAPPSH